MGPQCLRVCRLSVLLDLNLQLYIIRIFCSGEIVPRSKHFASPGENIMMIYSLFPRTPMEDVRWNWRISPFDPNSRGGAEFCGGLE